MFARLDAWLDRTAFPRIADPDAEAVKVALLRVAAGLVLVWRCGLMLQDSWYYFDPVSTPFGPWRLHAAAAAAQLALAAGLTLGLWPALCAVALMATHPAYSIWTGTYNLGPMLLTPTLGAFAVLETRRLGLRGAVRPPPSPAHYRVVYAIVFAAYAGWNFQALLYHVRDTYWVSGDTAGVLFANSYLSQFYGMFRAWHALTPRLYAALSVLVVVCQSLFQLGMVPLMGTRRGARFVRFWGWVFILGSMADLKLSVLPVVEAIMWTLVFVPGRAVEWALPTRAAGHDAADAGAAAHRQSPAAAISRRRMAATSAFVAIYGALLVLYFGNGISRFALARELPAWIASPLLVHSGLVAPNVFNRDDLTMGDRWLVLERLDGPRAGLVPFDGPDGERLSYHWGDQVYFDNSLMWRRGMIDVADLVAYHQPGGRGYDYAERMAVYDYRRTGGVGAGRYRGTLFRNQASVVAMGADPGRYRPELVYEFEMQVGDTAAAQRAPVAGLAPTTVAQ